jgi:hypothetical protein
MSKQHTLGPAMRVKARAKQAKPSEIEAQRREIKSRGNRQRADHDRERLSQALQSRVTLGKAKVAK